MTQENVNLKITNLIHDITQLGYGVKFCSDFNNMVRIEFTEEWNDEFYEHSHIGCPDGGMDRLQKDIVNTLAGFFEAHKEDKNEEK